MSVNGYETEPGDVQLLPERLDAPLKWKKPRQVFVNSMSDLFHPSVPYDFILDVFKVMEQASQERGHVFQVLTKRPGRAVGWWDRYADEFSNRWPSNIWIGTSVESQKYAHRITVLERIPAPIRFVSAEPLLEPVDLRSWLDRGALNWLIVGGESGRRARTMDIDWVRQLRDQALDAGVAFFLKQLGGSRGKRGGDEAVVDGRVWRGMPWLAALRDEFIGAI